MNYLVYSANSEYEAHFIKMLLENYGISCDIKNLNTMHLKLPFVKTNPEVWIFNLDQVDKAKNIINKELSEKNNSQENIKEQKCKSCNESSPGTFSECWNCQKVF